MINRAQFLKSSCTACAMLALPGIASLMLQSCASLPTLKLKPDQENNCKIPISKFANSNMLLLRVQNFEFDLLIIKKSDLEFKTLELRCTHENQPLTMSSKNIYCASHGSIFDLDGNAIKQPATLALKSFKTKLLNNELIIKLI